MQPSVSTCAEAGGGEPSVEGRRVGQQEEGLGVRLGALLGHEVQLGASTQLLPCYMIANMRPTSMVSDRSML